MFFVESFITLFTKGHEDRMIALPTHNILVTVVDPIYDGSVKYFYFSAQKAGATEEELLGAANIAAAASGLNVYARLPKDSVEPPE